jgi:asparagine synthase (glutamine-hydrolysing)
MLWLWEIGILAERMESWKHFGAKLNLDYAYPLTDRRLMDFLIGLPPEAFIGENYQRRMMRKAMEGILPDKVCWQPDKREKVRVSHGIKTTCEAYSLAREEILSANEMPSRAKYFEMESLLDFLSPDSLAQIPKRADAIKALQFLDF